MTPDAVETPKNLEAEEHVLGAILLANASGLEPGRRVAEDVRATGLQAGDFYFKQSHGHIYDAALALVDRDVPADALSVEAELDRRGQLAKETRDRLTVAVALAPPTANAAHHARLILGEAARRRQLGRLRSAVDAVQNGGITAPIREGLVELLHEATVSELAPVPIFALPLLDFLAQEEEHVDPLLGDDRETIIAAGGLTFVTGMPASGKTTLVLDGVFHLASGLEWLGFKCPRPLRVLIIENEGPSRLFRRKLAAKRACWKHELPGAIFVQTWRWGSFTLADAEAHLRLRSFLEEHEIDLVVGDPLGTLGTEGVGSPEDTRRFVALLIALGLFERRAFLFLHHFRKETAREEIDQIQGAWGNHLDTLLVLKKDRKDQARLSFPKLRWSDEPDRKPLILGRVRNTHSFEVLGEEGDSRLIVSEIEDLLEDGKPRTRDEIALKSKGGIEARKEVVAECLEQNDHLFESFTGAEAKAVGRDARAVLWCLRGSRPGVRGESGRLSESGAQPADSSTAPEESPFRGGPPDGDGAGLGDAQPFDVDEQGNLGWK